MSFLESLTFALTESDSAPPSLRFVVFDNIPGNSQGRYRGESLAVRARSAPASEDSYPGRLDRRQLYIPQRSAGVCTGLSQCLLISSSSTQTVKEAPAISSEVV